MAEPCDPEVLHARVCVLEKDNDRHENDISKLWTGITDLKLCAQCLPGISDDLREIKRTVELLTTDKNTRDGINQGRIGIWNFNRWWIERVVLVIVGSVILLIMQHLKGLGL